MERGRRCLEVGAGGGSIAAWLCDRVAPDGTVVATDLDTTVLEELAHPELESRVHDVLEDDLPEGEFDLVHMRLLLIATGLVDAADLDAAMALCADRRLSSLSPVMMTACGRRRA